MKVYSVPTERGDDGGLQAAHADEHDADPENYQTHYTNPEGGVPQTAIIATDHHIGTYDELVEEDGSGVTELNPDDRVVMVENEDGEMEEHVRYPSPEERADEDVIVHDEHAK